MSRWFVGSSSSSRSGSPAGVRVERRRVRRALRHRLLELGQPRLDREQVAAAAEHVVAQRQVAVARRALVVEREPGVLRERELPAVDARLAAEHAQQRGLARAVAAREREPVAALELERDAPQERASGHVLGQIRGDDDGHEAMVRWVAMRFLASTLLAAALLALAAPAAVAHDGGEGLWGETN